ncbi:MAG: DUF1279 domain-containing protein [Myxococcota bacterium]
MVERFKTWWSQTEARRTRIVSEYGNLAIVLYLLISAANVAIVYLLLQQGFEIGDSAGQAATLGLAWVSAKVFIPARVALLVVLTPAVAETGRALGWLPALPPTAPTSTTTPSSE